MLCVHLFFHSIPFKIIFWRLKDSLSICYSFNYIYFVKILTWLNIGCMNNQVCDTCSGEWYRPRRASSNLFLFWLFSVVLSTQQLFHMTYKMYIFSLYTNCFGLFILVIGYGKYANTGYEENGAWLAGKNI